MKGSRQPVTIGVVAKMLKILEVISTTNSGLTLKPISQASGVNKATAYRLLNHLERESYLVRSPAGAYRLGPKWLELARAAALEVPGLAVSEQQLSAPRRAGQGPA